MVSPYLLIISFWLIWVLFKRWQLRRIINHSKVIGSRYPALPLIGHGYLFAGNGEVRMNAFKKFGVEATKHNGMTSLWLGYDYYTVISDPVIAEVIMKSCLEKGYLMQVFSHLLGNGSVIAPVNIWRPRRKVVTPNFSMKNLQAFVKVFSRQSEILADCLASVADKNTFSIWKYFTTYSMDSVCETTLGIEVHAQGLSHCPFLWAFEQYCRLTAARMCQPWLWARVLYRWMPQHATLRAHRDYIRTYVDKIIKMKSEERKCEELSNGNERDKSLLELLLTSSLSELEVREECLVLVLAGSDTSAVGASFTACLLSHYPHVQDKVYDELYAVFKDSQRPVEAADLPKLKYLEAVIKESMRLYPPAAVIARKLDKDIVLPSGVTLVEGSGALINIWAMHRNPRYWGQDAELFLPDRFLPATPASPDSNSPPQRHAAYMPFSYGPRNCIGYQYGMMSMKTALAAVVRRYRLLPAACPPHPLRVKYDIMMRDVDNYMLRLEPRS
ncbi:PREDICTED: cytochrome P450 4V2-like [Papilio xuthus]|uniref:Cytochrome P450 4V2-like n=1 Tax=Papilio xuthus TaxID=66420 RepID=A0AAJ7EHP6_PAPXU|nr:PREDICTED: cytochrome P450 4V2-like [Papilio xuthus]